MIKMTSMDEKTSEQESRYSFEAGFNKLANSIHAATNPNAIMVGLRRKILSLFKIEMATIFLVDSSRKQLVSWVLLPGNYLQRIRLPVDYSSVSGYVAKSACLVNIRDVEDREELESVHPKLRFDKSWDIKGGSKTRQILAAPIKNASLVLGVVLFINRADGQVFDSGDEERINQLAETLAIALRNHQRAGNRVPLRYDELVKREIISSQELDRAFAIATQKEQDVESVLVNNFRVAKSELGQTLAQFYKTGYIDLATADYQPDELLKGVNIDYFRNVLILPLKSENGKAVLAAYDPGNQAAIAEMMQILRANQVKVLFAFRDDIQKALDRIKSPASPGEDAVPGMQASPAKTAGLEGPKEKKKAADSVETSIDQRPVVMLVNKIIEDGYTANASDIHIEPYGNERDAEVRYRIDGSCSHILSIPKKNVRAVVARVKVLADLNISEKRKPQDGKIKFRTSKGKMIELRVATIPTARGDEDVILRILTDSKPLVLKEVLPEKIFTRFNEIIRKPYGMILVVGPTGSGKTTTLHSALHLINTPEKKIWTAEDPVEITQYRLRQVQVRPKIGYTFAAAMRAFLRADPDVIMVGEMRDFETAKVAVEASLTGHLVFSTLHTNSAAETITRLIDIGIDIFNFADSIQGILAQRLVRTLCPQCKVGYTPSRSEYDHLVQNYGVLFYDNVKVLYSDKLRLYKPKGCHACNNSGYKGRIGIYELLVVNYVIKDLIIKRASAEEIRMQAVNDGMTVLLQEGIHRVFDGVTDYNQVMSVCSQ
jgi:type II secretory ATPase GspE/PulE/Tfp pilus assembly ATPase PilB-like protein